MFQANNDMNASKIRVIEWGKTKKIGNTLYAAGFPISFLVAE